MRFAAAASATSETSPASDHGGKPGRQIVTFLLVCNLGLWITYNFEMQKVIDYYFAPFVRKENIFGLFNWQKSYSSLLSVEFLCMKEVIR